MREIKFRAWDLNEDEYIPWESLKKVVYNQDYFRNRHISEDALSALTDPCIILEQFTGLRDKNNKEIYDGDIVHVRDVNGCDDVCDTGIGPVVFLESCGLWYVGGKLNNGLFDLHQENYIEVIGNIHEPVKDE
jgi:uncharacterized phage protein (TIGR01671 family)